MKKKILFVHTALWNGGIETALTSMLGRIDYDRFDVTCLILSDQRELANRVPKSCTLVFADRQHPVTFSHAYPYTRLFNLIQEPQNASWFRWFAYRVLQLCFQAFEEWCYSRYIRDNLNDTHFDAVVMFSSKACGVAVKAVTAENYVSFYHYSDLRRVYHDELGYAVSSRIFAVSEHMAEHLKAYLPQYADKIEPLHNLVDTTMIREQAARSLDWVIDGAFCVVSCGRLVADKGFDFAIQACTELVQTGFTQIQWYVLGEGPDREKLQELIFDRHMEQHFYLLGKKSNPYPYIRRADLFVQSSRIESFGLTITEALALGRPVLSTRTDGGIELISDRVNGLLCDISAEAIAAGVRELLCDPALRERLAKGAAAIDFEAENAQIMHRLEQELQ